LIDRKLAAVFGVGPDDWHRTVTAMLDSRRRGAAGYWLQLVLAMAIATLGLVLDSTAVIIGAMLVSPLMTPIIELGMGLAIGSPVLVVRAAARVATSVVVVIGSAAAVILVLPIQEITSEISARTSPTVLDLAIASCCAIAGVYAVIRPGSDTASTAAGTAIGIALVPPLCVVGYGVGTGSVRIAGGAALLFTANLCAILLFSVLGFLLLGYARVDVAGLERTYSESDAPSGFMTRIARRLSAFFSSKLGPLVRIAMPALLVAIVFWPLKNALAQVTWEVRVRAAAQHALRALSEPHVQSSVRIEGRDVTLSLVAVGSEADAARLRRLLSEPVARAAGRDPHIEITMVPDAKALEHASAATHATAPAPPPQADPPMTALRRALDASLAAWPDDQAGPLLATRIDLADRDAAVIELVHLGPPLGPTAESVLARSLAGRLDTPVRVRDLPLPARPIAAAPDDGASWLAHADRAMATFHLVPASAGLSACVVIASAPDASPIARAAVDSPLFHDDRTTIARGDAWELRFTKDGCPAPPDAGSADASRGDR
jgi:uncharacterized hydrophobic protein (TIGR00271 family)